MTPTSTTRRVGRKANAARTIRVGIDFGGVIVRRVEDCDDETRLGEVDGIERVQPDALNAIREIVRMSSGNVWIISKAGPSMQEQTVKWLERVGFYQYTGVARENLRFVVERKEKAGACVELGIDHFLDDQLDVLEHLRGVVSNLYLFGNRSDKRTCPAWITLVLTWHEFAAQIRAMAEGRRPPWPR